MLSSLKVRRAAGPVVDRVLSLAERRVRHLGARDMGSSLVYDEARAAARPGRFERILSDFVGEQHIAWLLREQEVDLVLDVGANRGQYAQQLRREGYRGRIVSFEPLPHLVRHLREVSADDPAWTVQPYALGDEDGPAEINRVAGTMSSLLPTSDFGRKWSGKLRESTRQTIEVRRLESVWEELTAGTPSPRTFLKLDTQGYDLQAFRGAGRHVAELVGMQSEVCMLPIYEGMPRFAEQLAAYEAAGFGTTGIFPVSRQRSTMRVIEFDLVMVGPAARPAPQKS